MGIWLVVAGCVQWVAMGLAGMFFQVNIFSTIEDEDFKSIVSAMLFLLMEFLVVYFWLGKKPLGLVEKKFSMYQYVFLFLAFVFFGNSIALFSFLRNKQEISDGFILYFFWCIILLFISILYLFDRLMTVTRENHEARLLQEQTRTQQQFVEEINTLVEHYKFLSHDYRHHLEHLYNLSHAQNDGDSNTYVKSLLEDYEEMKLGFIENQTAISLLLMQKVKEAKDKKINFIWNVPEQLKIQTKESDLNVIVANLLENAFEAASKLSQNKKVTIDIYTIQDVAFLKISNTFDGKVDMWNTSFVSTKKDKSLHGYGLKSVKKIVEDYDGTFDYIKTDDEFFVRVSLPV